MTIININRKSLWFTATLFLVMGVGRWCYSVTQDGSKFPDSLSLIGLLIGAFLLDIHRLEPAPSHTIKSLLMQYCLLRIVLVSGYFLYKKFDKVTQKCKEHQESILKEIITQNKDTEFAKDHGLTEFKSVEHFRYIMPLTRYENYRKYADRVKEEGRPNVLFPGNTDFVALTSGTTSGKSKAFPKSSRTEKKGLPWLTSLQYIVLRETRKLYLKKWVFVQVRAKITNTRSGIRSGPVSAMKYVADFPFVALPTLFVYTEYEALYIHLVFGLAEEDTVCFSTMVTTTALSLFTILEKESDSICKDIENGKLSDKLNIPEDERSRLNRMLKPNPERAAFLRGEFTKGFRDIVSRIWPSCPCLQAIKTGVFETSWKIVKQKYVGDLPCVTFIHIGTETMYGMNIDPFSEDVNFVAFLPLNFFEFIPVEECGENSPTTVLAHQVEVGQMYEVVVTTFDGLCRYRTEDVVKITGFHGTTPVYKFMHRAGDILTASTEKVPEFLLNESVVAAAATWKRDIVQFTSCESVHVQLIKGLDTLSRHYIVFIEFRDTKKLDETETELVDKELRERHSVYSFMRANKKLEPVQLVQVKAGTFGRVKELMLKSNPDAFCMQFKLPRITRRADVLKEILAMEI